MTDKSSTMKLVLIGVGAMVAYAKFGAIGLVAAGIILMLIH